MFLLFGMENKTNHENAALFRQVQEFIMESGRFARIYVKPDKILSTMFIPFPLPPPPTHTHFLLLFSLYLPCKYVDITQRTLIASAIPIHFCMLHFVTGNAFNTSFILLSKPVPIIHFSVGAKPKLRYMGYFAGLLHSPGRKSWLLFSVRDISGGLKNPCFTKFPVVNFL